MQFSDNEMEKLHMVGTEVFYGKGSVILSEHQPAKLCFVLSGHVALYKESRFGEPKIVFICGEKEVLDELVMEYQEASVFAKALDDVEILEVPSDAIMNSPEILEQLNRSLAQKARRLYHQVGNATGTYPLEKHLLARIWKLVRDYGMDTAEGRELSFEISVTMLASMLGAKRESVSRAVSKLKEEKLISLEKGRLAVPDMEMLRSYI